LEKELLPALRVRLAADRAAAGRFEQALKEIGHGGKVRLAGGAARLERRFQPPAEGGTDPGGPLRQPARDHLVIAPGTPLFFALPPGVRPADPSRLIELQAPPLDQIFGRYVKQFDDLILAPGQPRDLVLRGQYVEATRALGPPHDRAQDARAQFEQTFE